MTDPFAAYQLPKVILDGVDISLDGTPATFKVKLPSSLDDEYQARIMRSLSMSTDIDKETGEVRSKVDAVALQEARKQAFFDTCIVSATGLPNGMEPDAFFAAYPLAARKVFSTASEMALEADQEAEDALGKLKPTQNGKSSGKVK